MAGAFSHRQRSCLQSRSALRPRTFRQRARALAHCSAAVRPFTCTQTLQQCARSRVSDCVSCACLCLCALSGSLHAQTPPAMRNAAQPAWARKHLGDFGAATWIRLGGGSRAQGGSRARPCNVGETSQRQRKSVERQAFCVGDRLRMNKHRAWNSNTVISSE